MAVIILGKSRDDKGTQLEQFIKTVLKHQGFTNISTNVQVGGGSEIDVVAFKKTRVGVVEVSTPVICECKAHKNAIDLPDWLKFIGKLHIARKKNPDTIGLMIALNGANGNATGSYKDDFVNDDRVQLIANDDLVNLLQQVFNLPTADTVRDRLSNIPDLKIEDLDLVYYKKKTYWLVSIGEQQFTICEAKGDLAERSKIKEILPLLKDSSPYNEAGYVNFFETFELQRRINILQSRIITEIANGNTVNRKTYDILTKEVGTGSINPETIAEGNPFFVYEKATRAFLLRQDDEINFCDMYRFLLSGIINIDFLYSNYYQSHIDRSMLEKIWTIQSDFHLEESDVDSCLTVLKLSPSAMLYALTPDVMFQGYKVIQSDKQMKSLYQSHFKKELLDRFQSDFQNPNLSEVFVNLGVNSATVSIKLDIGKKDSVTSLDTKQNLKLVPLQGTGRSVLVVTKEEYQ